MDSNLIINQVEKTLQTFLERVGDMRYIECGISMHEALAFICACETFQPTIIIDSGVAGGRSTEMWARFYPNTKIIGMDWGKSYGNAALKETCQHLTKYPNVEVMQGVDSCFALPVLLEGLGSTERVAVHIDGPKGLIAVTLATEALKHSQVKLVAIHDMCTKEPGKHHLMSNALPETWYTDNTWWQTNFAGSKLERDPAHTTDNWYPDGPGMGLYLKEKDNEAT